MKISPMRFMLSAIAAVAVTGFVGVRAENADSEDSAVKILTSENFKEWTDSQELSLVKFFAPWCGHCKAMAPEYEKAAIALKEDNIGLGKVDCTTEQELCEEMEVAAFPTLKVFKDGEGAAYNGTRKEDGIIRYMRKQRLPPLSPVTADNFDKFTKSDRIVVVGFIEDSESREFAELELLAKELRDEYTFGVISDSDLAKEHDITFPGVAVFKEFDGGKDVYDGEVSADELRKFVKASSIPVLGEISSETYPMYSGAGLPFGFIFFDGEDMRKDLEKTFYPIAKEHKGTISFVFIDANKYSGQADYLNLSHEWPAFAIQNQTDLTKYPFSQDKELSEDDIHAFVKSFVEGELEPSYKSEPIPKSNDEGVFVLVSKQFNEIVFDKSKDVLVEFYAPWCGHCKRLAPIYEDLAKVLGNNENLVISKMDATSNDVPSSDPALQIQGFPTIVLVRGEDNSIIEYNGDRTLKSFVEFLEENATNKIEYNEDDLKADEDEDDKDAADVKEEPKEAEAEGKEKREEAVEAEENKAKDGKAPVDDKDADHDEL